MLSFTEKPYRLKILFLLFTLYANPVIASFVNWAGGTGGNWDVPTNWSNAQVPNSSTNVSISLNLDQAIINTPGQVALQVSIANTNANVASQLLIQGGGTLTSSGFGTLANHIALGSNTPVQGTVIVTDSNSSWICNGDIYVGFGGASISKTALGFLYIQNGGHVSVQSNGILGNSQYSTGTVTIQDTNSIWAIANDLIVGNEAAAGILDIQNGGQVTAGSLIVGNIMGSTGTVSITNGGQATAGDTVIGNSDSSTVGTVTISDANSSFSGTATLIVGNNLGADGTFTIQQGAQSLINSYSIIGNNNGSTGTVTVKDSNSLWSCPQITLGNNSGSSGTLNLDAGGTVSTGSLSAGSGTASVVFTGGIVQASESNSSFISGFTGTALDIQGAGVFIDSQEYTISTSNVLTGVGSLTKLGSGSLILSGANTYAGLTTVSLGTLTLDNGSIAGNAQVSTGSTFSGIGSVGGTVTLTGGTISPGNPTGTLSLSGDLDVSTPQSIVAAKINLADGTSTLLNIGGAANLNGNGILELTLNSTASVASTTYTILNAAGLVNGQFASNNFPSISIGSPRLVYNADSIQILLSLFTNAKLRGLSGNNLALAQYLNTVPSGTLGSSFEELIQLSDSDLNQALSTMNPSRNSFGTYITQVNLLSNSGLLNSYLGRRFSGEGGNQSNLVGLLASAKDDFMQPAQEEAIKGTLPYSLWGIGYGDFARQAAADENPEFHIVTGGAIIGFDYGCQNMNILDAALIGAAASYFRAHLNQDNNFGKSNINAVTLGLYGTSYISNFYIQWAAWNGWEEINSLRNVFFATYSREAKSSHAAYIGDLHAEGGYDYEFFKGCLAGVLQPFLALDWAYTYEASYNEHGAAPYNMHQKSRFSSIFQSEIGLNAYFSWPFKSGLFTLFNTVSYINREPFNVGNATVNIVGAGGSFTVNSFNSNQSIFSPGIGVSWRSNNEGFTSILYNGEFGDGWISNELVARIGKSF